MILRLPTEHRFSFLDEQEVTQARLSLHLSKRHIVGNHMSRSFNKCYYALYASLTLVSSGKYI